MDTKKQLRIVMMVPNQVGKGTYWRALQPAQRLVARGHRVTLIAMAAGRRACTTYHENGVHIVATPDLLWGKLRSGWDLYESLLRIRQLRAAQYDLLHFFASRPTVLLPALYARYGQRKVIVNDWCDWFGRGGAVEERPNRLIKTVLRPVETFFERVYRPYVDGMTVVCTTLEQEALAMGLPPSRILFWRDGADTAGLQPLDKERCRRALGLPLDKVLIGYVGAIFYRDAQLMARAFDQLHRANAETRLLLIGYFNQPLERMTDNDHAVIRSGHVTYHDLNRYLAACDLCWLPYCDSRANRGRYPLKLNDYMAVARPTVATAVGDVATIFKREEIGLLAAPTAAAIAAKTVALFNDPDRQVSFGRNARRLAAGPFNWERRADDLEAFYYRILAQREQVVHNKQRDKRR